jgi:FMN hydrolase / 5-amino-6-(5-phospho-D-ribitylamino)uracil phosphatase
MPPSVQDLGNIRALAFDLDNTLWEVEPVLLRAEERLLEWLREHWPRIPERFSLEDMRVARRQLALDEPERAHDFNYLRTESMARHARECGYAESVGTSAFEVFFAARNEVEAFADVRPALTRLRERYVLATLSNGNADLAQIGLAHLFAASLNACAVGCAKPDRRAFDALVSSLSIRASEIAYVGDDPWIDVEGARLAGLRTVWMNRVDAEWPATLAPPELVVRECGELLSVLTEGDTRA